MNRSNGLTANAAVIWQESSRSFVHILTNSSGVTNSNLVVQSYANVSVGNVLLINNAGIYVDGTLGSSGQVLQSDGSKTYWGPPGGFTGGAVPNQTTFASNVVVSNTTSSTSNVTGALVVLGGAGIQGNAYVDAIYTRDGILWAGNGVAFTSGSTGSTYGNANVSAYLTLGANIGSGSTTSNLVAAATTTSISTTTGALVVRGGAGIAGNVYIGSTADQTVLLKSFPKWADNTVRQTTQFTTSTTTPTNPIVGDQWYDSSTDIVYEYINDGTNNIWVDISSAFGNNFVTLSGVTVKATGNAQATSTTTGDLQVTGGASIATGNLYIGGSGGRSITATGNIVVTGDPSTSDTTGALVVRGGLGVTSNVTFAGNTTHAGKLVVNEATNSEPYIMGSGAFHVAGGISIGKDLWVGGNIWVNNVISQTSTILQVSEPLVYLFPNSASYNYDIGAFSEIPVDGEPRYTGIVRSVQSGEWVFFSNIKNKPLSGTIGISDPGVIFDPLKAGNIIAANTTVSTSTTTGALVVKGGAGIAGNLYIGGSNGVAIVATGNIIPSSNLSVTNNLGSDTRWWNNFYGVSTQARYADLAENYLADAVYEYGTVVCFGGEKEITISTTSHDPKVAGVISKNPAHLMNGALTGQFVLPLALQGRVHCQVKGPISKGDLVVASDVPGTACRLISSQFEHGCLIGKSLETILDTSIQLIEVVVGRD
jgi:hypothetical protein